MACSLPHTVDEIYALVQKLIHEDCVRQEQMMNLAVQFDDASTLKTELRRAYEECNDIPQESRALIGIILKEESDKDYEMNLAVYRKAAKIEKQIENKYAWLSENINSFPPINTNSFHHSLSHINTTLQNLTMSDTHHVLDSDGALMSTQGYMQKLVEDAVVDDDFNSGAWITATNYVLTFGGTLTGCLGDISNHLKKGKLEHVVAMVKSCSVNSIGDLSVILKDLSGTVRGTVHKKILDTGCYAKIITPGAAMILRNVSVWTPKPGEHYLNITIRNLVEVFPKDTIVGSGSDFM